MEAVALHGHLCAGQVLGVRLAMAGCRAVGVDNPMESKRLLVYVEIDRCATDAIQTVTGCKLGKRTLKYLDYGKIAPPPFSTRRPARPYACWHGTTPATEPGRMFPVPPARRMPRWQPTGLCRRRNSSC